MKVRTRLVVTAMTAVVPAILAVMWLDARDRHAAAARGLERIALASMLEGGRAACERAPERWGGAPLGPPGGGPMPPPAGPPHGRPHDIDDDLGIGPGAGELAPPILWAYDRDLHAANRAAPAIDGPPDDGLWPGTDVATLIDMPWREGPCARILAIGSAPVRGRGAIVPRSWLWLVPPAAALALVLVAAGPIARRIRQLTRAVRDSAAVGFTAPVPVHGDDEVSELAGAFNAASREVLRLIDERDQRERALREYLANTTHDVMIPLTVLQSYLTTIHEQQAATAPISPDAIVHAMTEAHYIGALLHNLAATAALDAGAPRAAVPVDLGALVGRVLARHRPLARQRSVAIDGAVPEATVWLEGDVTLLEQAVNNVVYNAIKYNRPGGNVGITLDRIDGGQFRLRVVDDGLGIPEADLARLVERGYRSNAARTRAPEGQGLGLAIAFRVAAIHGCALRFAPSEYGGLQVDLIGDELVEHAATGSVPPERGIDAAS